MYIHMHLSIYPLFISYKFESTVFITTSHICSCVVWGTWGGVWEGFFFMWMKHVTHIKCGCLRNGVRSF